jgi:protein O-mannosyl-transferase
MRTKLYPIAIAVLAVLVVAVAYFDTLDAPFIWDDLELLDQTCVRSFCGPSEYLASPFWNFSAQSPGAGVLYRPLTTFSLAVDWALHGRNAAGFHASNIVFHLANVALLAALARRFGATAVVASLLAMVWGLLPRLAESVAWVSGRTDILYAFAAMACLLLWTPENKWRRGLALVFATLAALAKEAGIGVLVGLAVAEYLTASGPRRWKRIAGPLGVLSAYLWLRHAALSATKESPTIPLSMGKRVVTVFEAFGRYVWMSLDCWHPKSQIGVVGEPRWGYAGLGLASVVLLVLLIRKVRPKPGPLASAALSTGAIPLLLVIHLMPMPWVAVAGDRLMYLPWAVVACALAVTLSKSIVNKARLEQTSGLGLAVLAATLLPCVRQRARLFSHETEFWVDTVQSSAASNWGPTVSLASLYNRGGWPERSLAIVQSLSQRCASARPPGLVKPASRALARLGKYEMALSTLQDSDDSSPEARLMLARLRLSLSDMKGAEADCEAAIQAYNRYTEAQEFLRALERVKRIARQLSEAEPGVQKSTLTAQLDMLSGRIVQAEQEWLSLLQHAELEASTVQEGFAFICEFGSSAGIAAAIDEYRRRPDAKVELLAACEERARFSQELDSAWPRVREILRAKNSSFGHCGEYGPFSD